MSALTERLVVQMLKLHQRELEVEVENTRLVAKQRQEADLRERLTALQEQAQKVEAVRQSLEKLNEEAEDRYKAAQKSDEEERGLLSQQLKEKIEEVNALSTEVSTYEAKVNNENRSLKEQLEIFEKHGATGEERYNELRQSRDVELEKIREKHTRDVARVPELQKQLDEETAELDVARKELDVLKGRLGVYLNRFAEIQTQLDKTREAYDSAKEDKERQMRTIRTLDSERQTAMSRAQKSRAERDRELEKVRVLEEKLAQLKAQAEQFTNIAKMLESPSTVEGGATSKPAATADGKAPSQAVEGSHESA